MAFTASLLRIDKDEDRILGIVVYTDGATKVIDRIVLDRLTAASFKATVAGRIAQLAGAAFVNTLPLGPIDSTPDPVVKPPDPSPADVARAAWVTAYVKLQRLARGNANGVPVDTAALAQQVRDDFRPEYETLL